MGIPTAILGGLPTFAETMMNGEVAPEAVLRRKPKGDLGAGDR